MILAHKSLPHISLRLFNNYLSVFIALLALYIIVAPFWPQFMWWAKHDSPVHIVGQRSTSNKDNGASVQPTPSSPAQIAAQGDRLIIPRLDMQETIYGGSMSSLRKGVWHLPKTSTPDKGGNTVLVGHRFTYSGQAVFYYLDKVQRGDPITISWQGKVYNYTVTEIKVVPPTETSVEANTKDPRLTIYTCTPLLTAKNRLVIVAEPVETAE